MSQRFATMTRSHVNDDISRNPRRTWRAIYTAKPTLTSPISSLSQPPPQCRPPPRLPRLLRRLRQLRSRMPATLSRHPRTCISQGTVSRIIHTLLQRLSSQLSRMIWFLLPSMKQRLQSKEASKGQQVLQCITSPHDLHIMVCLKRENCVSGTNVWPTGEQVSNFSRYITILDVILGCADASFSRSMRCHYKIEPT